MSIADDVAASRQRQGLPPKITDGPTIRRVAVHMSDLTPDQRRLVLALIAAQKEADSRK